MNIVPIDNTVPIVNNQGKPVDRFRYFLNQVAQLSPIIGTGSPEGVILAGQSRLYMDDAGTAGNILYVKRDTDIAGDGTKGWILV